MIKTTLLATKRAEGTNVAHKRGFVGVTITVPQEHFEKIKASALKNCRSLTSECLFRVLQSMESEASK